MHNNNEQFIFEITCIYMFFFEYSQRYKHLIIIPVFV